MSDQIKHECAVTLLRLRRGVEYFQRKYGTAYYGFQKLALMLEKQHNRGQDGAGIACVGLDPEPGVPCYRLEKSTAPPASPTCSKRSVRPSLPCPTSRSPATR